MLSARRSLLVPFVLCALLSHGAHPSALAEATTPPSAQDRAEDVPQPDGWDTQFALPQPEDLNPSPDILEFNLEARVAAIELRPGVQTEVWTYNGMLPGPFIRAKVGDTIVVHFRNSLPEPTTIHWHGVRVPNAMDGAPGMTQDPIAPGAEFRYEFVLKDAGTFWYHPHQSSTGQVGRGLYGPIVVEDPAEPDVFGDELVLMLSDMSLDDNGRLLPADNGGSFGDLFGREGNVLLVNGRVAPRLVVRRGKPQRWRIINAARARYFSFFLPGEPFTRIGGDAGLAARPQQTSRLMVVPGERVDVVYTPSTPPGRVMPLRTRPVNRGYGTDFERRPELVMEIETTDAPPVVPPAIPTRLREIPVADLSDAVKHTIDLTIAGEGSVVEMGINGVPSWEAQPLPARIGETHVWTVRNDTSFDHPFHLHGYFFRVLDDERIPEWKDTVNVPVKSSLQIAIEFDERPGMWMYHCHILDHADVGMMGHLHVE